jgi:acyl-coenzyme A thioesterase PaaI-like protein
MNQTNKLLSLYHKFEKYPFGKKLFSIVVSRMAPYFTTISPKISELVPNQCTCLIKKRKKVFNHIKTVHVIAICNGLEMAMGVMAEASIPPHLRWIPKGMKVNYTAKAGTDIRCVAKVDVDEWQTGDMLVKITAYDAKDVVVVEGEIKLWISEKPRVQIEQV